MSRPSGLHLLRDDDRGSAIDALADAFGGRVGLGVLGDLNRRGRRSWAPGRAVDRAWTFDGPDRRDPRWWPQGISVEGSVVVVTWYAKKLSRDAAAQGARVTFFDLDTCRYRHVLLVRPTLVDGRPGIEPLPVHAGGLVWAGGHLHVAATAKGLWTCSLDDLLRLPDSATTLRSAAFGYRYVLPVRWGWRAGADEETERLRYSFLSHDPVRDDLIVGEYAAGTASRRLARIALDRDTGLPVADSSGHVVPELLGEGVGQMQGAVRVGEQWYATTSHGRSRLGSVWAGSPGALTRHRWATPMGPEDLTHDAVTDHLWSVTEHPWARWIYCMKRSWFD